jgi:hypothetical protein
MRMNRNRSAGKWLGTIIYELDQLGNAVIGPIVSPFGGQKDETWSSAMGKALLIHLLLHPDQDPHLERPYYVGMFFNWICERVQKCHSLRSIEWEEGYQFANKAEAMAVRDDYLKKKGINKA